ncbi:MAG: purine-nucleoside phosphorylase [Trueperaceae bacterium]|nr:purine-nucleoside phosphorylase [Trueperaceae bacterium]
MPGFEQVQETVKAIRERCALTPQLALVLGSGLGGLADVVEDSVKLSYSDLSHFPVTTAQSHKGRLVMGFLSGKPVVMMQGRLHYYEGYSMAQVVFPIRVMQALGASTLLVTNAAGGLEPSFKAGDLMLISDHINLFGTNPLLGKNDERFGPRFPDMSDAYDKHLQKLALSTAKNLDIDLKQGVYVGTAGPTFETSAERRFMRVIGGSSVGMSTVPEVIAANHLGMSVLGFSAITNVATGEADQPEDDPDEVVRVAGQIGERLERLVRGVIQAL